MSDDTKPLGQNPGWYPDPADPTSVIYWDGHEYGTRAPAPPKPASSWKMIRVIALGVLAAFATAAIVWSVTAPSEADCALNDLDRKLAVAEGEPMPEKLDRCP